MHVEPKQNEESQPAVKPLIGYRKRHLTHRFIMHIIEYATFHHVKKNEIKQKEQNDDPRQTG